jgi:penicillin-binding protein 2B
MQKKIRVRSIIIGGFLTLLFLAVIARLYVTQVVDAASLQEKATDMWDAQRALPASRGTIYDRNMQVLAGDALAYTVAVNPKVIHGFGLAQEVAAGLSKILQKPQKELFEQVTRQNADGEWLVNVEVRREGWKIDKATADRILAWKKQFAQNHNIAGRDWPGVVLFEEKTRVYPKHTLASHILGYVDKDGKPWMGLELTLNDTLSGTPGSIVYQRDRKGQKLPGSKPELVPPIDGKDVVLTIDQTIQHFAEMAISKAYQTFKPKSMTAIVVNPKTMEVLALANVPNFDPNEYWEYDVSKNFVNTAIQSRYEPGSTFKLVTLAAAVDQGIFKPEDLYQSGSIQVLRDKISDHRRGGWGKITYLEGVLRSSNVAFVKLGYEQLGEKLLREYIVRMGFTVPTGIDLPGEVGSVVNFHYPSEIATATFGQGQVIVTPIQQLSAYAAIANGGNLMKPYVVKRVIDSQTNEVIMERNPELIREVVSNEVAQEITGYLEQVVSDQERGTGKRAYLQGYRVAGKTGTANKVVDGQYSSGQWVVSFIGYAPANDPQIAVAVIADAPDLGGNSNRAGEVTAPVFKEIVSQSLRHLGVSPQEQVEDEIAATTDPTKTIPDMTDLNTDAAIQELKARGFVVSQIGNGGKVLGQYPLPGEKRYGTTNVYLLTVPKEQATAPNLVGQSLRDVVQLCLLLGWKCKAEGEGFVVRQEVEQHSEGFILKVVLKPTIASGVQQHAQTKPQPMSPD